MSFLNHDTVPLSKAIYSHRFFRQRCVKLFWKNMAYAEVPPLFCEGDLMLREAMSHKVLRLICSKAFRPVFTQYVLWFWLSPLIYCVCDYVHTICILSIRYRWFMYIYHVIILYSYIIYIYIIRTCYKRWIWSTPQTGSSDIFVGDSSQLSVPTQRSAEHPIIYSLHTYIGTNCVCINEIIYRF